MNQLSDSAGPAPQASIPASFDVIVVGGGPAGLCAALELRRLGRSVCVVERSDYRGLRVGEHLSARGVERIEAMSLGEHWARQMHLTSPGVVSVWDRNEPTDLPAIFRAEGLGLHIARPAFERSLCAELADRGGTLLTSTRLIDVHREGNGFVVEVQAEDDRNRLGAQRIVDASGRAASVSRRLGRRVVRRDRLVGLCAWGAWPSGCEPLVEATPRGWWYSAPVPERMLVAIYFTDSDLRGAETLQATWQRALEEAPHTRRRLGVAASEWRPSGIGAATQSLGGPRLDGCVAVGDAALALDPLASAGLTRAIEGGVEAARAIHEALAGDAASLERYEAHVHEDLRKHQADKAHYYGSVTRFAAESFWQRRACLNLVIEQPVLPNTQLKLGERHAAAALPLAAMAPDIDFRALERLAESPLAARTLAEQLRATYHYEDGEIVHLLHALIRSQGLTFAS